MTVPRRVTTGAEVAAGPYHDEPGYRAPAAEPDYYQRVGYAPAPAEPGARPPALAVPAARSGGLAAMESMLAGAELLMVGCGEEEAW